MIHISPWASTVGLMRGAGRVLPASGLLFLYGPYRREGRHTAPRNEAFDQDLRRRNPEWGVRDLEGVADLANGAGFGPPAIAQMPAKPLGSLPPDGVMEDLNVALAGDRTWLRIPCPLTEIVRSLLAACTGLEPPVQ